MTVPHETSSKGDGSKPARKRLDSLDVRILEVLQQDVSLPMADLAERLRSSKSVVWRRVQEMLDAGVIRSRVAIIDPRKVGLNILVFVRVRMEGHARDVLPQFIATIKTFPEVLECHSLLGDVDFLLKVIVPTLDDYESFFVSKLSRIEGVREVTTSVSMGRIVSTTQLPLRAAAAA
jgi:Lrp/AsnC family transcriptional regulator